MSNSQVAENQVIEIPVNMNGVLRVTLPPHMSEDDFRELAMERFTQSLKNEVLLGESGEATYSFDGEVWGTEGQAQVGNLMFEVQHDLAQNISGAVVALKPRAGGFGANRYRSRVCAYVSEHEVYVTAFDPKVGAERVLTTARMEGDDVVVHVMNPTGEDAHSSGEMTPLASIPFSGLASALN